MGAYSSTASRLWYKALLFTASFAVAFAVAAAASPDTSVSGAQTAGIEDPCVQAIRSGQAGEAQLPAAMSDMAVLVAGQPVLPFSNVICAAGMGKEGPEINGFLFEIADEDGTAAVYSMLGPNQRVDEWRGYLQQMWRGRDLQFETIRNGHYVAAVTGHPLSEDIVDSYRTDPEAIELSDAIEEVLHER